MWKLILVAMLIPSLMMGQKKGSDISKAVETVRNKVIKLEQTEGDIMVKMIDLDNKLEKKLGTLIKRLTTARDSGETGTMIIRNKKKIIGDLQKAQKAYQAQRDEIDKIFVKDVKYINHDIYSLKDWMDKKINIRIKQITKVADSLAHYREYYDGNWRNQYNDRRNVQTADREKNRIVKDFEKEIDVLTKKSQTLIDWNEDSAHGKKVDVYNEMKAVTERMNLLEHSVEDILNGGKDGKKVSKIAALRLDKEIRKSTAEINGYLKTFLYAVDSYERTLNKRKETAAQLDRLNKLSNK